MPRAQPRAKGGAKGEAEADDWDMMVKLKAECDVRERRKIDGGDRPEYRGAKIDQEKFRFKESEARANMKERRKAEEEAIVAAEKALLM